MALHRLWASSLLRRRLGRLAGAAIGVALATALVAALLDFIGGAARSMTARAAESHAGIDWQVQFTYGGRHGGRDGRRSPARHADLGRTSPCFMRTWRDLARLSRVRPRRRAPARRSASRPTTMRLCPARSDFCSALSSRSTVGPADGGQSSRHRGQQGHDRSARRQPGRSCRRRNRRPAEPETRCSRPSGCRAALNREAPPDNVVLLSAEDWRALFDQQASANPGSARLQLHVRLDRASLPSDPVERVR